MITDTALDRPNTPLHPGTRMPPPFTLMYHRIADTRHDPNHLVVHPARFAAQMAWLHRMGLRCVSVGELLGAVRAGRGRRLIGLTFDDGYADLPGIVPVLQRYGFNATVFVVAGRLGGINDWDADTPWPLLDAAGVRGLAAAGVEIGSHGTTHTALAGADPVTLHRETRDSRQQLADVLGAPVTGFAYPYGSMDAAARAAVGAAGYGYGCAVVSRRDEQCALALPRVYAGNRDGAVRLAAKRLLCRWRVARGETATPHGEGGPPA